MSVRLIPMTRRWCEGLGHILIAWVLTLAPNMAAAEWEKLPALPEPNGGFVMGCDHGHVVLAGGTNWEGGEKRWLSGVHAFDPAKRQWKTREPLKTPMAYGVAGCAEKGLVFGNAFMFGGGYTGTAGFADLVLIEGHGHRVVRAGLPPDKAVVLAAGGVIGDRLIFAGGTSDPSNLAGLTRSTFRFSAPGKVEMLPDYPGKPFGIAASAVEGDTLFVFGGANWTGKNQEVQNTDEAHAFSLPSKTWRALERFPYPARGLTAVSLGNGVVYIAGGYKNDQEGFTDQAFFYHIADNRYTAAPPLPYKAMVGLVVCDGFLYCLGGEDKQKSRTDACFRIRVSELLK